MTKFEQIDISQKVMRQIHDRKITMKPRWYFVVKKIGFILAVLLALASSIFFLNLVIFKFRIYDPLGYFLFGVSGLKAAMGSADWEWLFVVILTIGMFFGLLKFSKFWWRYNPVQIVAVFVILITAGAFTLDKTGINDSLRSQGKYSVFFAGEYANDYWVTGRVIGVNAGKREMYVLTPDKEMVFVIWGSETKLPNGSAFTMGDTVQAVGHLQGAVFEAQGITIR